MKRTIIEYVIGLPVVVLIYTLLEFLYCTFFTKSPFVFDIRGCIGAVIVWTVVVIVSHIMRKKKENK